MNNRESKYEKFLNRLHTDKVGDAQVVIGGEMLVTAIVLLWTFIDSSLGIILKVENNLLFLSVCIGLVFVLLSGIALLIYGITKKIQCKTK